MWDKKVRITEKYGANFLRECNAFHNVFVSFYEIAGLMHIALRGWKDIVWIQSFDLDMIFWIPEKERGEGREKLFRNGRKRNNDYQVFIVYPYIIIHADSHLFNILLMILSIIPMTYDFVDFPTCQTNTKIIASWLFLLKIRFFRHL